MKEGTKVKVVYCHTGHQFRIGEIVERRVGDYDGEQNSLGFYSEETDDLWYMQPDEYEIVDKGYVISLMVDTMNMCRTQGFSRDVWERISAAIEQAEEEMENE